MKNNDRMYTCCICGGKFEGYGNNPRPLAGKNCCTACDYNYVIPVRELMSELEKKYKFDETPYDRITKLLKNFASQK